jgi:hypothetical protein
VTAPESITEDELAGALAELGIRINGNAYFPELARNIFGYIERQRREPELVYAVGDLFEDREGKQWYRVGGGLPWRHVLTSQHHREDHPARPLRKLVPLPSRQDLLAALEEDISREHGYDGQANRIFKLLEGGSGD